jgi:hypothetical protein
MKQYIFILYIILSYTKVIAQDISIEFSIEWKNKLYFQFPEFKNENIHPAFLNITYRNISEKPLYCSKITDGKADLPEIVMLIDSMPYWDEKSWLRVNDDYFKRKYFVGFKSQTDYAMHGSWDIRNDTADIEYKIISKTWERPIYDIFVPDENGIDTLFGKPIGGDTAILYDWLLINLDRIYNAIYQGYYPKIPSKIGKDGEEQWHHYLSDIAQDTIMNNSIDKFVFLKPNETYIHKYNLIGFQITGGTFTFQLDDTKSLDYVETEPVYKDENKFLTDHYQRKQLPLKVAEYELFKGKFLTNKVTVQFPGIKLNDKKCD